MSQKGFIAPTISKPNEKKGILTFVLQNTNYSVANAIRRTVLTDIDNVVLKTNKQELITIHSNTTRFHNEIIKQRLSCIPVHIKDIEQNLENLVVEINEENTSDSIKYITTKDFKIKDIKSDKYLEDSYVKKIFPPNPITKEFILLARLRPRISENIPGEKLHLNVKLSVSNAGDEGCFNVVSTCAYGFTGDIIRQTETWQEIEDDLTNKGVKPSDIEMKKKNWFIHDSKRIYLDDSFDFTVETVGVFSNIEIMIMACDILINKSQKFYNLFEQEKIEILKDETTMENSFDIVLQNEDYTLGKVIEYLLHEEFYKKKDTFTYVGFLKPHPHDNYSIIRISFKNKNEADNDNISIIFKHVLNLSKSIFEHVKDYFKK